MTANQEIQKESKNYFKKGIGKIGKIGIILKKEFFSYKGNVFKTKEKSEESEEESEEKSEEESEKERVKKFIEYIEKESKALNYDFFKNYFSFVVPSSLAKKLYELKNKNKRMI